MPGRRHKVGENAEETVLFSEPHGVRDCVRRTDGGRGTKERGSQSPLWARQAPLLTREARGFLHILSRAASEHARHTLCVVTLCVAAPRCMYV